MTTKCTSSSTRHVWSRTQPVDVVDGDLVRLKWCVICGLKQQIPVGPLGRRTEQR